MSPSDITPLWGLFYTTEFSAAVRKDQSCALVMGKDMIQLPLKPLWLFPFASATLQPQNIVLEQW